MAEDEPLAKAVGATADEAHLVDELGGLTLESIRKRGPVLEAKKAGLQAQLLELASGACGTFIESADCVKRVHAEVERVSRHLDALERHLPVVTAQAEELQKIERVSKCP